MSNQVNNDEFLSVKWITENLCSSPSINNLIKAILEAQKKVKNIEPNRMARMRTFSYKYVDLGALIDEIRPSAHECGLVILTFPATDAEHNPGIAYTIFHVPSGEYIAGSVYLHKESHPHVYGAAFTYLRKYLLQGFAGIAAEVDDDASGGFTVGVVEDRTQDAPQQEQQSQQKSQNGSTQRNIGEKWEVIDTPIEVREHKSGVQKVQKQDGTTIDRPWTMWRIVARGGTYITFDSKVAGLLKDHFLNKRTVFKCEQRHGGVHVNSVEIPE